jgi:hypothetical protein
MPESKTSMDLSVSLPNELEKAIELLSHISGLGRHQLQKMKKEEVYTLLSYHIGQLSEEEQKLLSSHDQNTEVDEVTSAEKWKLVKRGVIKEKKTDIGTVPKQVWDVIKFLVERRTEKSRFIAENNLTRPITSDPLAAITPNKVRLPTLGALNPSSKTVSSATTSTANINLAQKADSKNYDYSGLNPHIRKWLLDTGVPVIGKGSIVK